MIDYEKDRVESVTQADTAKSLSNKVIELKNLEDELEKRMTEIMNEYSPILEGKSSEELKEKVKDKQKQLRLKKC